jgi:uncharacterized protein YkwD
MRLSRVITACTLVLLVMALPAPASAKRVHTAATGSMVGAINQARARNGLPALRSSSSLNGSSSRFSSWLLGRGVLAHRSRVSAGGHFSRLGEALAMHGGRGLGVGATVRMWMRSPTHRAVLLTRSMNLVGAGASQGRFRGQRATIWVVQTARR